MKKSILILVLLAVFVGAIALTWFVRNRPSTPGATNTSAIKTNTPTGTKTTTQNTARTAVQLPPDADHDGLSDSDEAQFGTDPRNPDTDNDGLTDREEVRVYQTDPRNRDTDGDGVLDGTEVKKGTNPKGDGLLLDLPTAIQKLNTP